MALPDREWVRLSGPPHRVHRPAGPGPTLHRLRVLINDSKVYEDDRSVVYSRTLMTPPSHVVAELTRDGWNERGNWKKTRNCLLPSVGRVLVYNPQADEDLTLSLDAAAVVRDREVVVRAGAKEVARSRLAYDGQHPQRLQPPVPPPRRPERVDDRDGHGVPDKQPYRLRVADLTIGPKDDIPALVRRSPRRESDRCVDASSRPRFSRLLDRMAPGWSDKGRRGPEGSSSGSRNASAGVLTIMHPALAGLILLVAAAQLDDTPNGQPLEGRLLAENPTALANAARRTGRPSGAARSSSISPT